MASQSKMFCIEWIDAISTNGWSKDEELPEPMSCKSVGYLLDETKKAIYLVQTISKEGAYGNIMCIPKGMIVKKTVIR